MNQLRIYHTYYICLLKLNVLKTNNKCPTLGVKHGIILLVWRTPTRLQSLPGFRFEINLVQALFLDKYLRTKSL